MVCPVGIDEATPVGLISAESSNTEIVTRVFSSQGTINGMKMMSGMMGKADLDRLTGVGSRIQDAPIYIYDAPNIRFGELRSVARQMVSAYKIKALFVDYVQIIQWENQTLPHHEQVANVSLGLKALARELRIPIVGLSQLKRDAEGREPQMADLDYSKQIEQDADALVFIYHPQKDENDPQPSKLLVKKNRDGAKGAVNVTFFREYVKFTQTEEGGRG
jgi:replicative DNA helicase